MSNSSAIALKTAKEEALAISAELGFPGLDHTRPLAVEVKAILTRVKLLQPNVMLREVLFSDSTPGIKLPRIH